MGINQFLPYATAGGANVVDQATYAAAAYVATGRGSGILPSAVYNKIARQGNFVAAGLAQFMADQTGDDILDDGNLTNFVAQLEAAVTAITSNNFTTGDGKLTMKIVADSGWVIMDDGTIGNAGSGGTTRANVDCQDLFELLWANVTDTYAPVSGGRGASAAADWAALKTIALTKQLGRAIIIAGTGVGLTARSLGQTLGEETHALTLAENGPHSHAATVTDPTHTHSSNASTINIGGPAVPAAGSIAFGNSTINAAATGISVSNASSGSGTPHNNMQPSTAWKIEIKL